MWKINASKKNPDWLIVIGPFDFEFKEDLKSKIPAEFRSWHDVLKAWTVHRAYRSVIEYLIEKYGEQVPKRAAEIHEVTEVASRVGEPASDKLRDSIIEGLTLGVEAVQPQAKLEGLTVREDGSKLLVVAGLTVVNA